MTLIEALSIVLDLAEQNALDYNSVDSELEDEALRQEEAIEEVASYLSGLR